MPFIGADTDALRASADAMTHGGRRLLDLASALQLAVDGVEWEGPDGENFRAAARGFLATRLPDTATRLSGLGTALDQEADEQDSCSEPEDGSDTGPSEQSPGPDDRSGPDHGPGGPAADRESDGFWGDLLGGPNSGYLGSTVWNGVSVISDVAGLVGSGPPDAVNVALDAVSAGTGLYDAAQSFQDGELYNTADGLITAGVNSADVAFTVLENSGVPPAMLVGKAGSLVTGALDAGWSATTMLAQTVGLKGGPGNGSTSRFLLETPSWLLDKGIEKATGYDLPIHDRVQEFLDGAENGYSKFTKDVRSVLPIDPLLDGAQDLVSYGAEHVWPGLEEKATGVTDWIKAHLPG